ncbi:MAG: GNAT family N-acetyltransferase, partial [Firmicutes bacterium]|nr:GNAT family N-acetyltransferase [Bacillota bacterium]
MDHKGTKTLNTDRLVLRQFTPDDAQAMFDNWAKDPEVTRFLTWQPHENAEITRSLLKQWVE